LQGVAAVRHRYAHHISNVHLSLDKIYNKIGDSRLMTKLTALPEPGELRPWLQKTLIYYNLNYFLQSALHIVRPPPPIPGGLLGGMYTIGEGVIGPPLATLLGIPPAEET
jgi:hypothetical protein